MNDRGVAGYQRVKDRASIMIPSAMTIFFDLTEDINLHHGLSPHPRKYISASSTPTRLCVWGIWSYKATSVEDSALLCLLSMSYLVYGEVKPC